MDAPDLLKGVAALAREAARLEALRSAEVRAALELANAGRLAEAVPRYHAALKTYGGDASSWQQLGLLQHRSGDTEAAKRSMLVSISYGPSRIEAHHALGLLWKEAPGPQDLVDEFLALLHVTAPRGTDLVDAEDTCRLRVLESKAPDDALRLASVQVARLRLLEAIETMREALARVREDARLARALATCEAALGHVQAADLHRAHAHYWDGEYGDAVRCYEKALAAGSTEAIVHARLAYAHRRLNAFQQALKACYRGLAEHPNDETLLCLAATLLVEDGQIEDGQREAKQAAVRHPTNLILQRIARLSLPIVYRSTEEIRISRERYAHGLEQLAGVGRAAADADPIRALSGLGPSFYLAYQGKDDKALQTRLGALLCATAAKAYPQWATHVPTPPTQPGMRMRVGYVSSHLYDHTVAKLFRGWLAAHDPSKFEILAYHLGSKVDATTQACAQSVEHFRHLPGTIEDACRRIVEDRLHVLVFLDLGMDDMTTQIASLRLAPVQCVAWGHPVTTGLPTIDYFLSSDLMEPEDGEAHYSERLLRLPGIGVNVAAPPMEPPRRQRADFGLAAQDCVYLSPQSVFKYLPAYDDLFPRIAARVPPAKFVFLRAKSENLTNVLRQRLLDAFERHGLDGDRFLVFLPSQAQRDYLDLNAAADVFLDQPGWSGGMTTLDALATGLPVVTWPGEFMRARHAFAFLRQLGLEQTVARDLDQYVEIAVRLGLDADLRQGLRQDVLARRHLLFADRSSVGGLERFYESLGRT